MKSEEKIYKVLKRIKEKTEIAPSDAVVYYRAGYEVDELDTEDEIMILNKLADLGIIEVVGNFSSEYE
ncbi:MAG: hypothetical protein RBS77_02925 [Candidatus Moranbacteria bacterium]|jgi:hypothetical protein|nr:hypothetical protein [Candidatus Moranbacteria bacterium]